MNCSHVHSIATQFATEIFEVPKEIFFWKGEKIFLKLSADSRGHCPHLTCVLTRHLKNVRIVQSLFIVDGRKCVCVYVIGGWKEEKNKQFFPLFEMLSFNYFSSLLICQLKNWIPSILQWIQSCKLFRAGIAGCGTHTQTFGLQKEKLPSNRSCVCHDRQTMKQTQHA